MKNKFKPKVKAAASVDGVWLRTWTGADRISFFDWQTSDDKNKQEYYAQILIRSVCDESGKLVLSAADIPEIVTEWDGLTCEKLMLEALELNSITAKSADIEKKDS